MILPSMISTGVIGIDSRLSMVPRSISRVTDSAVKISMVMVRMVPTRPGTMLSRDFAGRVVAGMGADFERRRGGSPDVRGRARARSAPDAERAERRAGRDRIGRIGGDQQRRLVAAPHRALETARDFDAEQHLAGLQQIVELGVAAHFAGEAEIARCSPSPSGSSAPRSLSSCSSTAVGRSRGVVLMA